mmetsp:Transcript_116745/g.337247  ORF Transcript_116745/g.337247 Transcript_116745/m.337247 type:complete len:274 (-) Transcript_116745:412-1233(-)
MCDRSGVRDVWRTVSRRLGGVGDGAVDRRATVAAVDTPQDGPISSPRLAEDLGGHVVGTTSTCKSSACRRLGPFVGGGSDGLVGHQAVSLGMLVAAAVGGRHARRRGRGHRRYAAVLRGTRLRDRSGHTGRRRWNRPRAGCSADGRGVPLREAWRLEGLGASLQGPALRHGRQQGDPFSAGCVPTVFREAGDADLSAVGVVPLEPIGDGGASSPGGHGGAPCAHGGRSRPHRRPRRGRAAQPLQHHRHVFPRPHSVAPLRVAGPPRGGRRVAE